MSLSHERATFRKTKTVYYTQGAVLSRISQNICLLSARFITKLLSKEDLYVSLTHFFHALFNKNTCIYNSSWAFQWSHRFVYTLLDSFVYLSINWPINTFLIENLAFGKYEVAVL